ncbi:hypothetical protein [Pelomonas sp. Root1217]|uniref:hypothetical protein n=1 Tax=Pelomonas sp. Root1217 TaxID=1736430 RepID=UPI000B01167B|nr:hypothetical protein [Pelomonas sp. Root1217]
MKRRSRSGTPTFSQEAAQLSLAEIEADIQRCLWGFENGGTRQGRKAYFKRLVWLGPARNPVWR